MIFITLYALFSDDVRLLLFRKGADPYFYVITILVMVIFAVEITFSSLTIEEYFLGLYFWLDCISTISLIADIGWLWDRITGNFDDLQNID